ncbi:hypothetical protein [Gordonia sp. (in: high G+C Gram-positive bacteria)]|uniref:hypothetical protein n=1 Tax=Gordonia sp. (in: high G+C Gram-positive bacteria) TaxID=84139 RepID=UPI0039E5A31F
MSGCPSTEPAYELAALSDTVSGTAATLRAMAERGVLTDRLDLAARLEMTARTARFIDWLTTVGAKIDAESRWIDATLGGERDD